ncbi:MAG: copper chaperone [Spirulina sp. DLM2.Bin59]|nr:MAG: copper chaperone [Spirulina sp. DLM2.Bin59]
MPVQLKVPTMVCSACVKTITTAITNHLPTATVSADLDRHLLTVTEATDPQQVQGWIEAAGHEVASS